MCACSRVHGSEGWTTHRYPMVADDTLGPSGSSRVNESRRLLFMNGSSGGLERQKHTRVSVKAWHACRASCGRDHKDERRRDDRRSSPRAKPLTRLQSREQSELNAVDGEL